MKSLILPVFFISVGESFLTSAPFVSTQGSLTSTADVSFLKNRQLLQLNAEANEIDDDEDAEPGTMRVAEIKSELDLRGINYSDCFDKESLANKLIEARASGIADPSIIDQFNEKKKENETLELDDDILKQAAGGDGTLPGGMPPEMLKQLMSSPEVMELMNDPKMQDVMKLMMTGGKDALEVAMIEDKEVFELVTKLNQVMGSAM